MDNSVKIAIVSILYLVLDISWVSLNFKMYNDNTIRIQGKMSKFTYKIIPYIFICYGLLLLSIIHIAIPLTLNNIKEDDKIEDKINKSIIYGGSVGFCIYGIYNMLSLIIYENFEIKIAIIDTLWGIFIYSSITFAFLLLK
jgi:uncharacterized membrane protein